MCVPQRLVLVYCSLFEFSGQYRFLRMTCQFVWSAEIVSVSGVTGSLAAVFCPIKVRFSSQGHLSRLVPCWTTNAVCFGCFGKRMSVYLIRRFQGSIFWFPGCSSDAWIGVRIVYNLHGILWASSWWIFVFWCSSTYWFILVTFAFLIFLLKIIIKFSKKFFFNFVLWCTHDFLRNIAGVFHCVDLAEDKLYLNHSLLVFLWRMSGLYSSLLSIFKSLLHIHFQSVKVSSEQQFGQNIAVSAAPKCFPDFSEDFMFCFNHANSFVVKPCLTAVALNAKFLVVGTFASCFFYIFTYVIAHWRTSVFGQFVETDVIYEAHQSE